MTEELLHLEYQNKSRNIKELDAVTTTEDMVKVPEFKSYTILIEVVNDIEYKTAICEMEGDIYQCTVRDSLTKSLTTYCYGKWKDVPVVVVKTGEKVGSQYQYGSWFETKKALYYMPQIRYVYGVGVCGAAVDFDDSGRIKPRALLGHVVVSSHIVGYDHQKKADQDQNRGFTRDSTLDDFYQSISYPSRKVRWEKGLHFGRVLSGSWLVANVRAQKLVLDAFRKDEIAFEMEGVGIAAACKGDTNVKCCLVVKGVSDYANNEKNDAWQPAAARNAIRYLSDMINIYEKVYS